MTKVSKGDTKQLLVFSARQWLPVPFAASHYPARRPPRWRWSLLSGCTHRIYRWHWPAAWRGWRWRGSSAWCCWCLEERGCRSATPRQRVGLGREVRQTGCRGQSWWMLQKINEEMSREDLLQRVISGIILWRIDWKLLWKTSAGCFDRHVREATVCVWVMTC